MDVDSFLGLSKKAAQDLCETKNMIFRLIKSDGEDFLSYPEDTRIDRICVELEQGKVVKATIQ